MKGGHEVYEEGGFGRNARDTNWDIVDAKALDKFVLLHLPNTICERLLSMHGPTFLFTALPYCPLK